MLFNRFISLATLLSVAASALAAPLPLPRPGDFEHEIEVAGAGVEIEKEGPCYEVEVEHKSSEAEIEWCLSHPHSRHAKRGKDDLSLAESILIAQSQLDIVKPEIEAAVLGPLGSIQRTVGPLMTKAHDAVKTLNNAMTSSIGADKSALYRNPAGGPALTDTELAKLVSNMLLAIAQIEEQVQHVSGYEVTSAQKNIRDDLLSMKKTLLVIAPECFSQAANVMAMALSIGTWMS